MAPCTCPSGRTVHAATCPAYQQHVALVRDRNRLLSALQVLVEEAKAGSVSRITVTRAAQALIPERN
jgi:hypothetical protein